MISHLIKHRKKLIEVAIPLDDINKEAIHRKSKSPKGFPSSLHKWWSPKPLASSRAVLFAQMVDDPSSIPEKFPDEKSQKAERKRLMNIISDISKWENTQNKEVHQNAFKEIKNSWQRFCDDNNNSPSLLFSCEKELLPTVWDPFAGSGSIPLSGQWLGLESISSDLNPVAAMINKAIIEYPYLFKDFPSIVPLANSEKIQKLFFKSCAGLVRDVEYFGMQLVSKAFDELKEFYPSYIISEELVIERPDLRELLGQELCCTAWIWARTVESPSPAYKGFQTPLATSYLLASKKGKEAYCRPIYKENRLEFQVIQGKPEDLKKVKLGSSAGKRNAFICQASGDPVGYKYIRACGQKGEIGSVMMAVVAQGKRGRVYLPVRDIDIQAARKASPSWEPSLTIPDNPRDFKTPIYGMKKFSDLFTQRQLKAYQVFTEKLLDILSLNNIDELKEQNPSLNESELVIAEYLDALKVYLGFAIERMIYYGTNLSGWLPKDSALRDCMPRQALAMTWEYAEANPFGKSSGDYRSCLKIVKDFLDACTPNAPGKAFASAAQSFCPINSGDPVVISTDPPYYDNISYSELADFFYVWQKRMFANISPEMYLTLGSPKGEELLASIYRYESREKANLGFLEGMSNSLSNIAKVSHPAYPVTLYYAFKQSELSEEEGCASTGWESFLESVISAGLVITATWPLRTEKEGRLLAFETNALASCIVLVCRKRVENPKVIDRREFRRRIRIDIRNAIGNLENSSIAPVDLAQAVIGPGMSVYSQVKSVLNTDDSPMSVRDALIEISAVLDENLSQDDGSFDADTRFALTFFESYGYLERPYGDAEGLAVALNISVDGVSRAGILRAVGGKVQLLRRDQLENNWDPLRDDRLCVWESTQYLIKALEIGGEKSAAALLVKLKELPGQSELASNCRALAYRLYNHCEKNKQAEEARAYNGLVIAWPDIENITSSNVSESTIQTSLI